MDVSQLDVIKKSNEGFEFQVYNPATGALTGMYITVLGRDSDAYRKLQNQQNRVRMERMTQGGRLRLSVMPSPEEIEREALELLVACTVRWRQLADGDQYKDTLTVSGEEWVCTRETVARLYKEYPVMREQADSAISERANFLKG